MESNIVDEQQKRLEEAKKDKIDGSINHFDRLNLLPSTNLMYVKYAFLNKLSMETNEKLTVFSLEDMVILELVDYKLPTEESKEKAAKKADASEKPAKKPAAKKAPAKAKTAKAAPAAEEAK